MPKTNTANPQPSTEKRAALSAWCKPKPVPAQLTIRPSYFPSAVKAVVR